MNRRGPASCPVHNRARRQLLRSCLVCDREYSTKGGNRTCPACLHVAAKHPCAGCGVPVDKRAEWCRKCWGAEHTGERSANWKGGVAKAHVVRGYVRIMRKEHPRASANGYVPEHTLVMEEMLGRFLLPGENVHHKNGQRADNRPENLELWVKSQPAGQRAVDLLAWAREIESRYGPSETVL